ncbi:hypothetical protein L6164_037076 [Bauhinia variegata]|uniref:Uncharacterized protein n=1 Tax=Bauhinia variegata TaxID=167791 RepID=A0ACB9KJR7_BAUVA|nr:hypothetical protein L6164_037076 [Bauhinia variegata]
MRRTLFFLLPIFLLFSCTASAASNAAGHKTFIHCLVNHSEPSYPITSAIFTPNNSSFSSVLEAYIRNLRFNTSTTRKPYLIITAQHVSHVQAAVVCAQKHNLQMKIRSGGHDYEGCLMLPRSPSSSLTCSISDQLKWTPKPKRLGFKLVQHLVKFIIESMRKIRHGASQLGFVPPLVLVVTSVERINGRDLFWAIRGGGGASFGVIIAYRIKIVHVPETVTVFQVRRTLEENATDIMYKWQQVAPTIDNDLFIRVILDVVNSSQNGNKTVRASFISLYLGDSNNLLSIMNEKFPELGLTQSDCIEVSWLQSVLFWTNINISMPVEVLLNRTASVNYLKRKSDYVKQPISKEAYEGIWRKMIELENAILYFNPYGGRMAEIPATTVAFLTVRGTCGRYMTPFVSKNPREAFFNYKDLDLGINHNGKNSFLEGSVYGVEYFKDNFKRLVQIKTKVDPGNFFRNEQSIPTLPYGKS